MAHFEGKGTVKWNKLMKEQKVRAAYLVLVGAFEEKTEEDCGFEWGSARAQLLDVGVYLGVVK